jgi:WD40 repeat protein
MICITARSGAVPCWCPDAPNGMGLAMTAMPLTAAAPLLDLLGARWRVGVAAAAVAWDDTTGLAGFALTDGTLVLVHPVWEGAPALRPREGGGAELVPRSAPAPPAARVKAHRGACLSVAADPDGGFLSGGADGRVTCVQADGSVRVIAHHGEAVALVTAGPGRWRACAIGRIVHKLGGSASRIEVAGPVTCLAVDPASGRLGIGHEGGITLWAGGDAPLVLAAPGTHCGLCWSPDRTMLASFAPEGTLSAWRFPDAKPSSIAVGTPVSALGALATGGGFVAGVGGRVVYWAATTAETSACGVPNQSAVNRIACHPRRAVIAAGYANGTVVLCQPNSSALLLLRRAGEGAVSTLAFSRSGGHLGIGTDGGEVAVLALPDMLFHEHASQQ